MLASKLASVAGFIAAAVLTVVIASPAFAGSSDDQVTIKVSVADLNMTSEAGAQVALARITHTAKEICGDFDTKTTLSETMQLRSCVAGTVERAVAVSNQPALLAVSRGQHVTQIASATR